MKRYPHQISPVRQPCPHAHAAAEAVGSLPRLISLPTKFDATLESRLTAWLLLAMRFVFLTLAAALSACGGGGTEFEGTPETPAQISIQPANQVANAGAKVVFSVIATGTSLSYQWQSSPGSSAAWTPVNGAMAATLTLTAVSLADNGRQFRVVVANSLGSLASAAAVLTVTAAASAPAITTQPADISVAVGQTAGFNVVASGSPSPTFLWQRSTDAGATFQTIGGANAASYTTAATTAGDNGTRFRVIVSNGAGSVTSGVANLAVTVSSVKSVALGVGDAVCAGRADDTLACWGTEVAGGGNLVRPATVPGVRNLVSVRGGLAHFCALASDATVLCWGYNSDGQLGNGTQFGGSGPQPALVPGQSGAKAVASGKFFSCAIKADRGVACWGRNSEGQLGDGTTERRLSPTSVHGINDAMAISAGSTHVCVLRATGGVACWGSNQSGELGDGTTIDRRSPEPVPGLIGVVGLAAGGDDLGQIRNHTCALKVDGTVACWGNNEAGQLGVGTVTPTEPSPRAVSGLTGVVAIDAGRFHTCALKSDGTMACWGSNGSGQLGIGNQIDQTRPAAVLGLGNVVALAAGGYNTCSAKADGSLLCWGTNIYGGLGDGTLVSKSVPTLVSGITLRLR